jgi:hypothetical protein
MDSKLVVKPFNRGGAISDFDEFRNAQKQLRKGAGVKWFDRECKKYGKIMKQ